MNSALAGCVVGGGACLAACYAFVLERYGESRCVPRCASVHCDDEEL